MAVNDCAYLAKSLEVGQPLTDNQRSTAIVASIRLIEVCRAMLGGTVVLVLMSYVQTINQLVICRLLQGAFTGTMAASVALVASVVPRARSGFTLGMMQTAVFIGSTIGPFFGGLIADAFGYRAAFRGGALLCLLGGLIIYFGTHENFNPRERTRESNGMSFRTILFSKGFLLAVVIMFGVQFGNTMINPSFPLIIRDIMPEADNINSITGSIMAASALAGAISAALLGYLGDRIGHRRIMLWACGLAGLASVGHYWANTFRHLLLARVLFGLTIASMLPAANAMIHNIIDQNSLGKAYGLSASISMIGVALGPLAGGALARGAGLRVPFLFTAGVQFALCMLIFFSVQTHKPVKA